MSKDEIIEYLYEHNVRGDLTIEQMAEDLADRKTEPQTSGQPYKIETSSMCRNESKICDFCRYYNSNIPCGSTPDACKKADKFAEEFVDGLKKLKSKDEPQTDCSWK